MADSIYFELADEEIFEQLQDASRGDFFKWNGTSLGNLFVAASGYNGSKGDTLFGSKLDDEDVDSEDLSSTSIEFVETGTLQEKFNQLAVEGELQVSLMSGLVKSSGSGEYLSQESKSARAQSMSLLYKVKTVNEEIMIRQCKKKIDMEILSPSEGQAVDATHVVFSIDWGAVCSVTCEYENDEDDDVTKVEGALSAELENLKALIDVKVSGKGAYDDKKKESNKKFTYICKADVSAHDKDLPDTFEGVLELARSLPSLVKSANNGKWVPLTYKLIPLDAIVKMCKLQTKIQAQLYSVIDDDIIMKCTQVVEGITKKRQMLYDIKRDLHLCADYVSERSLNRIDDIWKKFVVEESRFKAMLQNIVKKVRSGDEEVSSLDAFLSKETSDTSLVSKYNHQIRGFQEDFNKVKLIKSWKSKGIIYIGRRDNLTVYDKTHVYVFYKTADKDDRDNHDKNQEFFLRLQKTHEHDERNYKFIVVDQEIRSDLWQLKPQHFHVFARSSFFGRRRQLTGELLQTGKKRSCVHAYFKGEGKSTDLYTKEGQDSEMCLIKIDTPVYNQFPPPNRACVKLRCPNGECSGSPITWMCSKCKEVVEYGIETKQFYCKCGRSDPNKSFFRCNEKDHGMDYVEYPDDVLAKQLALHRAIKELNILILGETGVGKSTWINGFQNYLYYADMEEAINSKEFHVLIPSSFTFISEKKGDSKKEGDSNKEGDSKKEGDSNKEGDSKEGSIEIMVGKNDPNENREIGKSATKAPRSYVFYVDENIIRLIDTPGVGDSGGIPQDKKNFDNILAYLTRYEEIHAVCILLKPNNSRLTAMFRFCIQELLAHLHSSAKENIVFCFTNARGTFYKPGDTLPALNMELKQKKVGIQAVPHNYFCFDNEAFRFLACLKNGVEFSQGDKDTYAASWNKSVEETYRLFETISKLRPHQVRNTLSMNEARRIIVTMSKPLAEVAKTIQQNITEANNIRLQIELCDKDMGSMKAKLKFSGFSLKRIPLPMPRTVCTDSKCITFVPVGRSSIQNTVYQQVCHDGCQLEGIPTEVANDQRLQKCWCIWTEDAPPNMCSQCGHHYTTHMHITYGTEIHKEEFLSEEVQKEINKKKSVKGTAEALKKAIDTKLKELKEEETIIMKTGAKYGSFLKANALIPYNDAVGDYLDMCVDQEEKKEKVYRNQELLDSFQDMRKQYEKERAILNNAIGNHTGENIKTVEEVNELQEQLFCLKHMGPTLEKFFEANSISYSANNISFKETTAPIRQNYGYLERAKHAGSRIYRGITSMF
ncbi:uncharacterized protein [Amphiura filiformis]|uniref:uncharacterized protein n=1 Tax=Amphiura filiformis TaxID=82378 RepID=UPI003B21F242